MGSAIAEAQRKVKEQVVIPAGYTLKWTGDFENQQRASKRLGQVVPVSIAIIFIILFMLFGNARDAVIGTVQRAVRGGRRYSGAVDDRIQFLDFGGYRLHCAVRNLYPKRCDHVDGFQAEYPPRIAVAGGDSNGRPFPDASRDYDRFDGCHRFGSGSPFARYRFRIAASAGYRHYRRPGSRYLLHAVRLSFDRGGCLQPGILHERGKTSRAESVK